MMSRLGKLFKNVRFAAFIIGMLILVYFLGLIIPQKMMFPTSAEYEEWKASNTLHAILDAVGFTDIYLSPVTVVLLLLFFISLLVVTADRVPLILMKTRLKKEPLSFSADAIRKNPVAHVVQTRGNPDRIPERIRAFFREKKWYLIENTEGDLFLGIKNRLSPVGFLLFHLSFFLCLIGGLLIMYTRFSGKLALTEGQAYQGDRTQFHRIIAEPRIMKTLPEVSLFLEKVHPSYEGAVPTDLTVELDVTYEDERVREVLRINEPVKRGALSIIAETVDISPLFILKDRAGNIVDSAFVSLKVLQGREDSFELRPDGPYTFQVRFFPDYHLSGGIETTRSLEPRNPAVHLTVRKDFVHKLYEGTIQLGEQADLNGFTIVFKDVRYWTEFLIIREYGSTPLIAGFLSGFMGLIMRLLFYQKRVRMALTSSAGKFVVYVDGKSEYFQYSYREELAELAQQLENVLCDKRA